MRAGRTRHKTAECLPQGAALGLGRDVRCKNTMIKRFLKRRLLDHDLWFQRKTGLLMEHWRSELRIDVTFVLAHLLQRRDPLSFVQIGADDGSANDPLNSFIRRGQLRGVLVEPQPDVFARLCETYRDMPGLAFENCAIGEATGTAKLYRVKAEHAHRVPRSRQMSGFSPDVILKHYRPIVPDPQAVIETIEVPTLDFPGLLKRHRLEAVDFLQIDAEGHDHAILHAFDFASHRPHVVNFEIAHLSRADRISAYELLLRHDYLIYETGLDCVAYLRATRESAPGFWS